MIASSYFRWSRAFLAEYPLFSILLQIIPQLPVQLRKVILTYCRVQPSMEPTSLFYQRHSRLLRHRITLNLEAYPNDIPSDSVKIGDILAELHPVASSAILCGILSSAVRAAPYTDYSSIEETLQSTLYKELEASQCSPRPDLDFTPILSYHDPDTRRRMKSNLPLDPAIHSAIQRCLASTKPILSKRLFFPRTSRKTLGRACKEEASQVTENIELEYSRRDITCTEDAELLYHETGIRLRGTTELRSAFKYNDLKPRVYYAQGLTVYDQTRYIQAIFNIICDSIPVCHRVDRFLNPYNSDLHEHIRMAIYDYSSFTSHLTQLHSFCMALADFYEGTLIWIVDSYVGPIQVSLSEILRDYSEVCNNHPDFDISRMFSLDETLLLFHSAGMLGVPGNITPCTILHAIHLAVVISSLVSCRCVGDDAFVLLRMRLRDQHAWMDFILSLQNLGDVEESKAEFWDIDADPVDDMWHYVKRPIGRLESIILRGELYIMPSLDVILGLKDDYHVSNGLSLQGRQRLFLKQFCRFLALLYRRNFSPDRVTGMILLRYYRMCLSRLEIDYRGLLHNKRPAHITNGRLVYWVPLIKDVEDFGKDWVELSSRRWVEGGARMHFDMPEFVASSDEYSGYSGERGVSLMDPVLSYWQKLGYVTLTMKRTKITLHPAHDLDMFRLYAGNLFKAAYDFVFLRDIPSWGIAITRVREHLMGDDILETDSESED